MIRAGSSVWVRRGGAGASGRRDGFAEAASAPGLLTIHTEEATLEDIFVHRTGRRLEA